MVDLSIFKSQAIQIFALSIHFYRRSSRTQNRMGNVQSLACGWPFFPLRLQGSALFSVQLQQFRALRTAASGHNLRGSLRPHTHSRAVSAGGTSSASGGTRRAVVVNRTLLGKRRVPGANEAGQAFVALLLCFRRVVCSRGAPHGERGSRRAVCARGAHVSGCSIHGLWRFCPLSWPRQTKHRHGNTVFRQSKARKEVLGK